MLLQLSVPDNSLDSNSKIIPLRFGGCGEFWSFSCFTGPTAPHKTPWRRGGVLPSLALGDSSAGTLCVGFSVNQAPFPFYRTLVAPWCSVSRPCRAGLSQVSGVPKVAPKNQFLGIPLGISTKEWDKPIAGVHVSRGIPTVILRLCL